MIEERVQHPRAWLAVVVLATASLICQADKMLPSLLMEPIKHAMALRDTQVALLTGFAFIISISIASLPIAWLADRYDRTMVLAAAIGGWCLLTIASGFTHNFTTLFLCRLGVGIGEAALLPVAVSLLGDLLPLGRIAQATAIMTYAGTLGSFVAMAGGGALYEGLRAAATAGRLPLDPGDAWRWTTIAFGATGLIVALIVGTILPEPRRGPRLRAASAPPADLGSFLLQQRGFFLPFVFATCFSALLIAGFNTWLTPFFVRTYGWSIGEVGRATGTVLLLGGLSAPLVGVFFHRLVARLLGREAPMLTIAALLTFALPFVLIGPFLSDGRLAAIAVGVVVAATGGAGIAISVVFVSIAPSHIRARVMAAISLIGGLVGSLGAVMYAAVTEHIVGDPARLYVTMSLLSGLLILLCIVFQMLAGRRYVTTTAAAKAAESLGV